MDLIGRGSSRWDGGRCPSDSIFIQQCLGTTAATRWFDPHSSKQRQAKDFSFTHHPRSAWPEHCWTTWAKRCWIDQWLPMAAMSPLLWVRATKISAGSASQCGHQVRLRVHGRNFTTCNHTADRSVLAHDYRRASHQARSFALRACWHRQDRVDQRPR